MKTPTPEIHQHSHLHQDVTRPALGNASSKAADSFENYEALSKVDGKEMKMTGQSFSATPPSPGQAVMQSESQHKSKVAPSFPQSPASPLQVDPALSSDGKEKRSTNVVDQTITFKEQAVPSTPFARVLGFGKSRMVLRCLFILMTTLI